MVSPSTRAGTYRLGTDKSSRIASSRAVCSVAVITWFAVFFTSAEKKGRMVAGVYILAGNLRNRGMLQNYRPHQQSFSRWHSVCNGQNNQKDIGYRQAKTRESPRRKARNHDLKGAVNILRSKAENGKQDTPSQDWVRALTENFVGPRSLSRLKQQISTDKRQSH